MFNKNLKSRVNLLENVNNEQLQKINELEAKIHFLNTKVAYLEADNLGKIELIKEIRGQLKSEIEQKLDFQQSFKQLYTPSNRTLKEELNAAYVEDDKEVEKIIKEFIAENPGEL